MTRKHYRAENHKTIPTVEITLLGLSGMICSIYIFGAHKIDNPINSLISLGIATIGH